MNQVRSNAIFRSPLALLLGCIFAGGCQVPHGYRAVVVDDRPACTASVDENSSRSRCRAEAVDDKLGALPDLEEALCCDSPPLSFQNDFRNMWSTLAEDAKGIATWRNAAMLGIAAGGAIAIRQDLDEEVRQNTARHSDRWNDGSDALQTLGDVEVQIPALLGLYAYSLWDQNQPLHDLSGSLISAYALTTAATSVIKAAANTDRPSDDFSGGRFGFPSFHTSSSFALAAVVDEYHGHKLGVPAYALAGLVGWSRIDQRDHDLSDVFFGAALGYVIGKSVARRHRDGEIRVLPFYDVAEGTSGVTLEIPY